MMPLFHYFTSSTLETLNSCPGKPTDQYETSSGAVPFCQAQQVDHVMSFLIRFSTLGGMNMIIFGSSLICTMTLDGLQI